MIIYNLFQKEFNVALPVTVLNLKNCLKFILLKFLLTNWISQFKNASSLHICHWFFSGEYDSNYKK